MLLAITKGETLPGYFYLIGPSPTRRVSLMSLWGWWVANSSTNLVTRSDLGQFINQHSEKRVDCLRSSNCCDLWSRMGLGRFEPYSNIFAIHLTTPLLRLQLLCHLSRGNVARHCLALHDLRPASLSTLAGHICDNALDSVRYRLPTLPQWQEDHHCS